MCLKGDSSEIKVTDEFFETFPECSLPSTVSKNTIKTIGHHINRSKLHFAVARNIVYKSNTRGKILTGRKC